MSEIPKDDEDVPRIKTAAEYGCPERIYTALAFIVTLGEDK